MLTFCRRAACRAGVLARRSRHQLPPASSDNPTTAPPDHDYLALELPDATPETSGAAQSVGASVDELAARLRQRRRERPGCEAVIAASFGVIRLDGDNQPVVHGQFEPGLYGDGDGGGGVDPDLAAAMSARQSPAVNASYGWPAADGAPPGRPHPGGSQSDHATAQPSGHAAGFVDDQYFPEPAVSDHPLPSGTAAGHNPGELSGAKLTGQPQGVFEEQYFAQAFETDTASVLPLQAGVPPLSASVPPLPAASPLRGAVGDADPAVGGGATLEGRPDGVFEEQYFWAAFEDTGEEREAEAYKTGLAARYSGSSSQHPAGWAPAVDHRARRAAAEHGHNSPGTQTIAGEPSVSRAVNPPATAKPEAERTPSAAVSAQSRTSPQQTTGGPGGAALQAGAGAGAQSASGPDGRRSALDVVREMRAAARETAVPVSRGRQLRAEAPHLASLPAAGVLSLLKRGVLHVADDFIVLYKPPGLSVHSVSARYPHRLTDLLPELARHLDCAPLHTVHRLDRDTSGALLLAKTPEAARRLSDLLREGRVLKTYWALVRGAPDLPQGIVEIPVVKAMVGGRERMTLAAAGGGAVPPGAHRAVTRYRVLSSGGGCALLELTPATGARHQLRAHLGLGLGCPVLGDHKYSRWETGSRPQRLPPAALAALGLRAPEARHLPLHLHARALWLPGLQRRVTAPLPLFFKRNLKRLGVAPGRVKADGSNPRPDQ